MEARPDPAAVASSAATLERLAANLARVVHAPADTLRLCVLALIAEGHVIIEDFPGRRQDDARQVARALARRRVLAAPVHARPAALRRHRRQRLQPEDERIRVPAGPVFANILLVDEINRASPKTQAALLEAMQEAQVTIDGERTRSTARSWCSRRRTRSSTRAPTRCPRRSSTGSRCGSRSATRRSPTRRGCSSEQTTEPPLESLAPVAAPRRDPRRDRRGARDLRRGQPEPLRRRAAPAHPRQLAARARRQPARRDLAPARREGARARRRPRLRPPGRREGGRAARARAPADPRARGALGRADRRGDRRRGGGADPGSGLSA